MLPNVEEITEQKFGEMMVTRERVYTQQEFLALYEELVKKTGLRLAPNPVFMATNHGSFELVVQLIIVKI